MQLKFAVKLLMLAPSIAVRAADLVSHPAFAAPPALVTPSVATGVVRMVLALALVLGIVFAAAKLMRRVRTLGAGAAADLQIVAQISLGTRERAVLLRAGSQQLLLGVAPGNVRLLYALPALSALLAVSLSGASASAPPPASASAAGPTPPNFGELLRRSFGMKP